MFRESLKHKGSRERLVSLLQRKGITDAKVLAAVGRVPRHLFIDSAFEQYAYEDKAFSIGEGQTISHPSTVAFQTTVLAPKQGERILEIGTGSGYQSCILLEMGCKVFTIECNKTLSQNARRLLHRLGYRVQFFLGDGSKGLPAHAPYDKIIVTAGAPAIPQPLIEQLKINGSLVIPVGNLDNQEMLKIRKTAPDEICKKSYGNFRFVQLRGEKGWA